MSMKKVLVTGSTGSIGEACARYFHDNGYFVYLNYRSNETKANELHAELENSQTLYFDITKKDEETITLKKSGTVITISGEDMPKELSIKYNEKNTEITLKYDAFVLFDTGDLQEELEKICNGLTNH